MVWSLPFSSGNSKKRYYWWDGYHPYYSIFFFPNQNVYILAIFLHFVLDEASISFQGKTVGGNTLSMKMSLQMPVIMIRVSSIFFGQIGLSFETLPYFAL